MKFSNILVTKEKECSYLSITGSQLFSVAFVKITLEIQEINSSQMCLKYAAKTIYFSLKNILIASY